MHLLTLTALLLTGAGSRGDFDVPIQMAGITGSLSIDTTTGILSANLTGACGMVNISIHEFPVIYGASRNPCDVGAIGPSCYNVTMKEDGQVAIDRNVRYDGRSLALETCGQQICVNLVGRNGSQTSWKAIFHSFIIGQVYFLTSSSLDSITAVVELAVLEGMSMSNASLFFSDSCQMTNAYSLGSAEVGSNQKFAKNRIELTNVTVMEFLLLRYQERWLCAEVRAIEPKEASALFSMAGVSGSFTFRQETPFHPTQITIDLRGLRGLAGQYTIHSLPVLGRQEPGQDLCSPAGIGQLWDPLEDNRYNMTEGIGHSFWQIGNLSNRHGSLKGHENYKAALVDFNLPLYGKNSVIGRSVAIAKVSGDEWVCSTIRLEGEVVRAQALFHKGVIGKVMFQQAPSNPYSDLSIYIELSHVSDSISRGHNWHIHTFPLRTETANCTNAGGHFNPYNVSTGGNYSQECQPWNPLRCEAGDYAGKHTPISLSAPTPARYVFTDTTTSLTGLNSIIGLPVVIHGPEGASIRVACANILAQRISEGRTGAWFGSGSAQGQLKASQASCTEPTLVDINFQGLRGLAGGYHIHLLPVSGGSHDPCSNDTIKGHFNPFSINMSSSPAAGNGTDDEYEVGDLSGRHGSLANQDNVTEQYTDTNLPLSGTHSVLGRSLVIHYANGSRMQCASFLPHLPPDGAWVRAAAEFGGKIRGRISLSQIVYPDGGSSDTTILVDLQSTSSAAEKVPSLDWSIHTDDRNEERYNPYKLPNQSGNWSWCTSQSPQHCTVGDLTGKHGPISPGSNVLVTDINLPLARDFTVIGRKITVRGDNLELSAPIRPDVPVTSLLLQKVTPFNKSAFQEAVSHTLGVPSWKVTLLPDVQDNNTLCHRVDFFIIGYTDTAALDSLLAQESLKPHYPIAPCHVGTLSSRASVNLRSTTQFLLLFCVCWML
ncbi:uncharacterized protein LOC135020952 [Pseudophryne corroboree]|uniref:uncharacterized protein LOC135020952 n=1 Tax=Pseudophryne corroboree TaxID=495146 RepID=UPI0030818716